MRKELYNAGLECRLFRPKAGTVTIVPASRPEETEPDRLLKEKGYIYQALTLMSNMELYDTVGHNPMSASKFAFNITEADLDKAITGYYGEDTNPWRVKEVK